MIVRRKLIFLHTGFAAFAVVVAAATVLTVQLHVRSSITNFQRLVDQSKQIERLRVRARLQIVALREMAVGGPSPDNTTALRGNAFFNHLREFAAFGAPGDSNDPRGHLATVADNFESASDQVLSLIRNYRPEDAKRIISDIIEGDLLPKLDAGLDQRMVSVDNAQRDSVFRALATNTNLLALAGVIGAACVIFVLGGSYLVGRWLIYPIALLHTGTREFAAGNLSYRIPPGGDDELGVLGEAMNTMAASLQDSQVKYRSLFENLRDAVIIFDPTGTVVECHDGDANILGAEPQNAIGRRVADVWPQLGSELGGWDELLERVVQRGDYLRHVDVTVLQDGDDDLVVDINAYPVEYGQMRYAALVLRDATERARLQKIARRSETMEATETFARGIAHDFKNLLGSATATMSLVGNNPTHEKTADRVRTALAACHQAANLSKKLLEFSCANEGHPETLDLSETISLVIDSLNGPFMAGIEIERSLLHDVTVRIDKDHLTQVVLNLIYNAREAMPEGGRLRIATESALVQNPVHGRTDSPHAIFTVTDDGCGMTASVRERLFEPLYSTKPRGPEGVRGMGLAVVYAAVRHANGFVQVESNVGSGTTFRVMLPISGMRNPRRETTTGGPARNPHPKNARSLDPRT